MSAVAASSEEPAPGSDATSHEPDMTSAVAETVNTIKVEIDEIVANNDELENVVNDSVQPVDTTNRYQVLTNVCENHLLPINATGDHEQLTIVPDDHKHLTLLTNAISDHSQLTNAPDDSHQQMTDVPDNHHQQVTTFSDDSQLPNNSIDEHQQPASDTEDRQPVVSAAKNHLKTASAAETHPQAANAAENHQQLANDSTEVSQSKSEPILQRPPHIPPHLMGRDLNNPAQDMVGTGRRVQKPRLGVKVPYRNLTSQIVTQDEIAQEILERSLRKYSYSDAPEGGDMFFAMKLTHRLANKISSSETAEKKFDVAKVAVAGAAHVGTSTTFDTMPKRTSSPKQAENSTTTVKRTEIPDTPAMTSTNSAAIATATATATTTSVSSTSNAVSTSTTAAISASVVSSTENTKVSPYKTTTNTIDQPSVIVTTPKVIVKTSDSSAADELYAEISSTLKEEFNMTATPVQLISAAQLQTLHANGKSMSPSIVNGSMLAHTETELDNDTLLAILEGTSDGSETSSVTAAAAVPPPLSSTATVVTSTPNVDETKMKKRKKRMKPILDPLIEKELALKQLMDFEPRKKQKKIERVTGKVKTPTASSARNGVVVSTENANPKEGAANESATVAVTPTTTTIVVATTKDATTPKKVKRSNNAYNISSQAPKRFPKKYQRIIKRQLRSSKQKTKNISPDQQQVQKKLPEVPEVQIAIDRYIKTYASKRRHKPDNHSGEKPAEKKMKTETPVAKKDVAAPVDGNVAVSATVPAPVQHAAAAAAAVASPSKLVEMDENALEDAEQEAALEAEVAAELADKENEEVMVKSKANSKMMREINRLLGDEGAINMIYSVEQKRLPDNKRDANILPSARRKKKDLQLRTKLVKNAVLRLSMSSSSQGTPARVVRRLSPEATPDAAVGVAATVATAAPASTASTAKGATAAAAARKASIESVESTSSEPNNNNHTNTRSSVLNTPKTRKIAAEASRIIRRHSSSSAYSSDEEEDGKKSGSSVIRSPGGPKEKSSNMSGASVVESIDGDSGNEKVSKDANVPSAAAVEVTSAEKKDASKSSESSKAKSPAVSRRESREAATTSSPLKNSQPQPDACVNGAVGAELSEHQLSLKEITVRKYDNLVQIILISSSTKMKNAMNIDILRELISVLRELEKDDSCRTVLVTSTGSSFCQGIDLQTLICADKTERTKIVNEFVNTLVSFTKCLSQFRKILIAGVHGSAVGLGVTMLPFFDMVFASDKATFYTPYVKLGQIPEAGATLTLPHLLGNAVTSELLFGCRMLTASEALQFGLVTRTLWPDKFTEELMPLARGIASHSARAMEATKLLLRQSMTTKLEEQQETEAKLLRELWCSDDCQSRFKEYLEKEALLQNK